MDDAVNIHLMENNVGVDVKRFVVKSSCTFLSSLSGNSPVTVALRIDRLGSSSASYQIALYDVDNGEAPAAEGTFVHVYVIASHRTAGQQSFIAGILLVGNAL